MNLATTTNAKGVTLSAGVKDDAKPAKISKRAAKKAAKEAAKAEQPAVVVDAKKSEPDTKPAVGVNHPLASGETGTVIDPETGEAKVKVVRSIVPSKFKDRYKKHGGTCGDDMALELKAATTKLNADKREALDWDALKAIAEANGIAWKAYDSMNNGQKRMNIGNKLRGLLKSGKDVTVGTRVFKAEDMLEA